MKRKFLFVFIFFVLSISCFSQNSDLKYYSDIEKDYDGWALAEYVDKLEDDYIIFLNAYIEAFKALFTKINVEVLEKVSKKNLWLFQQALDEWDYKSGEIYAVFCSESYDEDEGILFLAIVNEEDTPEWVAAYINIDQMEDLGSIF